MISYQMKIHKEDNSWWGEFPDLLGCFTEGETKEMLLENAVESLNLFLEEIQNPDWEIPSPGRRKGRNLINIFSSPNVAIAILVKNARMEKGFTQSEFAKRMGITLDQLQRLEMPRKSNPTVKTLAKISEALDSHLDGKLIA